MAGVSFRSDKWMSDMFQTRLVREDDALLCFETLAFLIRRFGPPTRPLVPSPLHKSPGLESLRHDETDARRVFDWAQDSYATICDAMGIPAGEHRLLASVDPIPPQAGLLLFDPAECEARGQFVARIVLELCNRRLAGFDPGFAPSEFQAAVILLSTAAYFRQGFVLTHIPEAVAHVLSGTHAPQRFVENTLTFAACAALGVLRQTPEQIVATYGVILPKSVRKKVRAACRQANGFEPEMKLLRVIGEPRGVIPRGRVRDTLVAQPQRTSWT